MTAMTRHTPYRLATLVAALATLSLIRGGCTADRKQRPVETTQERALAECARITNELKTLTEVTEASCNVGGYDSNILVSQTISINASVADEAQVEPVADKATELAWLSNLQPLIHLAVTVGTADSVARGRSYAFSSQQETEDAQELTKRFGPRPKPSIAP